jgi:DNA/RNA endonuclease YhcR with UshA esterase domain
MGVFSGSAKRLEKERIDQTKRQFADLGARSLIGVVPIADVKWREKVKVAGRVKALRVQPWADQIASLELTLADDTGGITVVFLGRRTLGGVHLGTHLIVEGMTSEHHRLLTILNPAYQLLPRQVELPY